MNQSKYHSVLFLFHLIVEISIWHVMCLYQFKQRISLYKTWTLFGQCVTQTMISIPNDLGNWTSPNLDWNANKIIQNCYHCNGKWQTNWYFVIDRKINGVEVNWLQISFPQSHYGSWFVDYFLFRQILIEWNCFWKNNRHRWFFERDFFLQKNLP